MVILVTKQNFEFPCKKLCRTERVIVLFLSNCDIAKYYYLDWLGLGAHAVAYLAETLP